MNFNTKRGEFRFVRLERCNFCKKIKWVFGTFPFNLFEPVSELWRIGKCHGGILLSFKIRRHEKTHVTERDYRRIFQNIKPESSWPSRQIPYCTLTAFTFSGQDISLIIPLAVVTRTASYFKKNVDVNYTRENHFFFTASIVLNSWFLSIFLFTVYWRTEIFFVVIETSFQILAERSAGFPVEKPMKLWTF